MVQKQRKEVENQLANLKRQVEATDAKLRAYLADRENKPHPRHEELIEKIQKFRIDPAITTKQLEIMLDNLQWKVYYHNRAWRQLWENAEAKRKNERKKAFAAEAAENVSDAGGNKGNTGNKKDTKNIYSVDRLWELQRKKLSNLGEKTEPEAKEEFVARIKKRYGQLASEKKDYEEIVMKFDKREKRCTLEKKRKKEA